jgi:hypothetical protein
MHPHPYAPSKKGVERPVYDYLLENSCMQNPPLADKTIVFSEREVFK